MPYIPDESRAELEAGGAIEKCGGLNYLITQLCLDYINDKGLSYVVLAEVEGVLGHVAKEIYRRIAVPYENVKMAENGDLPLFNALAGGI